MPDVSTIFADGILDASITHGVARLTLAQTGPEAKPLAAGQLLIPLSQLPAFVNGLVGLVKQIDAKMKEAQAGQQQPGGAPGQPSGAAGAEQPSVPGGAFRFS